MYQLIVKAHQGIDKIYYLKKDSIKKTPNCITRHSAGDVFAFIKSTTKLVAQITHSIG